MSASIHRSNIDIDSILPLVPESVRDRFVTRAYGHVATYSPSSLKTRERNWNRWIRYIEQKQLPLLPNRLEQVREFWETWAGSVQRGTLLQLFLSVRQLYLWADSLDPLGTTAGENFVSNCLGKTRRGGRETSPIHFDLLSKILRTLSTQRLKDIREAALLSVTYEAFLRAQEIRGLCVGDFRRQEDGTALLTIAGTAQNGMRGTEARVSVATAGRVDCWIRSSGLKQGPLFGTHVLAQKGRNKFDVTASRIEDVIARRISDLGMNSASYSTKSLLIGAIQDLALQGFSPPTIAAAARYKTGWMVHQYCKHLKVSVDPMAEMLRRRPW